VGPAQHRPGGQRLAGAANIDIDAPEALAITAASPAIVVAVIDDGVDFTHPDLDGSAWFNPGEIANGLDDDANGYVDDLNGWDFCHGDNTIHDTPADSHGTAVAGTIAAEIEGTGIAGVAPGVKIMALKFLGEGCAGDVGAEIAAIEYARAKGVHIVNASFGGPGFSQAEVDAIGLSAGTLFVAAAGNSAVNIDIARRAHPFHA